MQKKGDEVKMSKRAKELEIIERRIYTPESKTCCECGEEIELQKHYQWRKTVQFLIGPVYVASRGGYCVNPECKQLNEVVTSPLAQMVTIAGYTYGLDVIAQIGWWRDKEHLDRKEIHSRLVFSGLQLSERQVDYLYNQYQILLACVGNQDKTILSEVVEEHGGLKLSLDGLAPEGASEQLWVVREVESQTTLVVAWLDKVNYKTLQELLRPVEALEMPIVATVSDKQPCLRKALEELWPDMPHQWCQPHYLSNIADPVYEQDRKLKTEMRQTIRAEVGGSLAEVLDDEEGSAVHFVAGVAVTAEPVTPQLSFSDNETLDDSNLSSNQDVPNSSLEEPSPEEQQALSTTELDTAVFTEQQAKNIEQVVRDFALDLRECLSRHGRAPFILAGLPMLEDLRALLDALLTCLKIYEQPHLRLWANVLTQTISDYTEHFHDVEQARLWVDAVSYILHGPNGLILSTPSRPPFETTPGECVQMQLATFISRLSAMTHLSLWLDKFRTQLIKITNSYSGGLFHCYDIPGLPSSNNAMESLFGQTKRSLRRRLGIQQLREALRRHGPWALLETAAASAEELAALFQKVSPDDYRVQRALFDHRLQQLLHRFRWRHRRDKLLKQRIDDWIVASSNI